METRLWRDGGENERERKRERHLPDSQLPWLTVTSASICPSPVPRTRPHLSQAGTHRSEPSHNRWRKRAKLLLTIQISAFRKPNQIYMTSFFLGPHQRKAQPTNTKALVPNAPGRSSAWWEDCAKKGPQHLAPPLSAPTTMAVPFLTRFNKAFAY